jgi:hypothetical protein
MKIFGKDLFNFKREAGIMYDFAQHGAVNSQSGNPTPLWTGVISMPVPAAESTNLKRFKKKKVVENIPLTPKTVYDLKSLNANDFKINVHPDYIKTQVEDIDLKLELVGKKPRKGNHPLNFEGELGSVRYGRQELESIRERLLNRSQLNLVKNVIEKYPHTTSALIQEVVTAHSNLRCEEAVGFIPDFPKDAVNAMKEYDSMCIKLCNKKTFFYVIADAKDFGVRNKRRDPILLAQSPFGHFWQILGAWDEEMVYLGDL